MKSGILTGTNNEHLDASKLSVYSTFIRQYSNKTVASLTNMYKSYKLYNFYNTKLGKWWRGSIK